MSTSGGSNTTSTETGAANLSGDTSGSSKNGTATAGSDNKKSLDDKKAEDEKNAADKKKEEDEKDKQCKENRKWRKNCRRKGRGKGHKEGDKKDDEKDRKKGDRKDDKKEDKKDNKKDSKKDEKKDNKDEKKGDDKKPDPQAPPPKTGEEWTIVDFTRDCGAQNATCKVSFSVDRKDGSKPEVCKYEQKGPEGAVAEQKCSDSFTVASQWSGQFGPGEGFSTLSVIIKNKSLIVWPAYKDSEITPGKAVKPDKSYPVHKLPY